MLKVICAALFFVSLSAFAGGVGDGCYALSSPGSLAGAVCITGSMEEGIGGSSAKVVYLDTVGEVVWCGKTASISVDSQKSVYQFRADSEIILIAFEGTQQSGRVTVLENGLEPSVLGYTDYTSPLRHRVDGFFASAKCLNTH